MILETNYKIEYCRHAEDNKVRCNLCQRRCLLAPGRIGYCYTKIRLDGELFSTIYGIVSTMGADPIEKKPIFHYRPGTKVLSLGSLGCNFRCDFCQNWEVAFANGTNSGGLTRPNLLPQDAIALAIEQGCQGIGWSFNEPSIWLEYVLECATLAKQHGLYTVYVTNGYITEEALDILGPYLDVYRVDVKSLSPSFYRQLAHGADVEAVLQTTIHAKKYWNMHIEVVTNIMPEWNDDDENLNQTAAWIVEHLGNDTPWHLTKFVPYAKMTHVPPTPTSTLQRAIEIGHANGLKFVYSDDPAIPKAQSTFCPTCYHLLISRQAFHIQITPGLESGNCPFCGSTVPIVW